MRTLSGKDDILYRLCLSYLQGNSQASPQRVVVLASSEVEERGHNGQGVHGVGGRHPYHQKSNRVKLKGTVSQFPKLMLSLTTVGH